MEQRINVLEKGQKAISGLLNLGKTLAHSSVEQKLLNLLYFRVSQINACAMCLEIHSKDLLSEGENEQRLFLLDAWRDAPFYTDRERAALAYAEALTTLKDKGVPDTIFNQVKTQFSESEIIDLTLAIITINSWNRLNIALGAPVGTYQVGQYN